jgi:hypothetical protein
MPQIVSRSIRNAFWLARYNHAMSQSVEGTSEIIRPAFRRVRLSLREYIGVVTIAMLVVGLATTTLRLRRSEAELAGMRKEFGYLSNTLPGQIAAARAPGEQALTYRFRVRAPANREGYRVAYSSHWPQNSTGPQWFGAVPVPAGESLVTVQILEDPRDNRWKISTSVAATAGTRRMATVLPQEQVDIFRGSHEVLSMGVGRETHAVSANRSIRILDERWLVGETALLLYGDRAPDEDQIGVYAELQPDKGAL